MVVKVYISGISGNKEVKKRQQRVLLILDSRNVKYEIIDIAEPGNEEQKDFMQNNSTSNGGTISDPNPRHPLPPQIFNDDVYCGDYDQFDMANEIDEMEKFLKLAPDDTAPTLTSNANIKLGNGEVPSNDVENETSNAKEEEKEDQKTEDKEKEDQKTEEKEKEEDKNDTENNEKSDEVGQGDQNLENGATSTDKQEEDNETKAEEKNEAAEDDNKDEHQSEEEDE